jgi:hypothetical protein
LFFFWFGPGLAWECPRRWNESPLQSLINSVLMANADNAMDNTTIGIANEVWSALADTAAVEASSSMKPFYDGGAEE